MLESLPILPLPAPSSQVTEQSNGTEDQNEEKNKSNSPPESVATHTRTIGIIHPRPKFRTIVDKTAQFVGKKGPGFEKRIIADNAGNAKFSFLNPSDPYHAYYQHRLSKARSQNQATTSQSTDSSAIEPDVTSTLAPEPVRKVLEPPEAEQYTVRFPEGITVEEVDIIKLTAQFVARNGSSFLTGLTNKERDNPQFHFLQPTHSLFNFFTSLADAYSKVLMSPKGLADKLRKGVADGTVVLERCLHRLEWERSLEQARQKREDEVEQERLQMAMIDWHDFVAVESIDFADDEDEELPAPLTLEEVARRSKLLAAMVEEVVEEIVEMELDEEEEDPPREIVKNWKRPEERVPTERDGLKYVKSPITGELIPINEMSEHLRISLIDPKYKEQKKRMYAKIRETTLARDNEISRNIVELARLRPDIFGTTEEEVSNAVKAEIDKKTDVHTISNLPGPTFPPPPGVLPRLPPNAVQYTVPPRPPLQMVPPGQQHLRPPMPLYPGKQHFMMMNPPGSQFTPVSVPQPFVPMPPQPGVQGMMPPPPPPPEEVPPPLPEEPEPKRPRVDDSVLIPEDQFLAQHPGPVRISISVLNVDEGNLKGQVLEITVQSLSETVGSLKEKIAGEIQFPSNKQKLSGKAGFLKDNLSLAYYNIAQGEGLSLSLRDRGGRKR